MLFLDSSIFFFMFLSNFSKVDILPMLLTLTISYRIHLKFALHFSTTKTIIKQQMFRVTFKIESETFNLLNLERKIKCFQFFYCHEKEKAD